MLDSLRLYKQFIFNKVKYRSYLMFDRSVWIQPGSKFEGANRISSRSFFGGEMGYGTYIGRDCDIRADIGRFTSIASRVSTDNGIHPYKAPFVTTSPLFYSNNPIHPIHFSDDRYYNECLPIPVIGNDCWIGSNVFIAGGVSIGDGAVIYSGSIIVKNVEPYSIVGGVPAKLLGYRYDSETIKVLLAKKWWENEEQWFKMNWKKMLDIDLFLSEE